jgi:hypothetical protein
MDRLIRLTGELDRYHGLGKPPVALPAEASPARRLGGPRRQEPRGRRDEDVGPERRSPGSRRERLPAQWSARKLRCNTLKRLIPGSEIVVPRKLRTYKMWYTDARLTVRSD